MEEFQLMRLVYMLGVLIVIAPLFWVVLRDRSALARNLAIWLAVAVAAAALFMLLGRG